MRLVQKEHLTIHADDLPPVLKERSGLSVMIAHRCTESPELDSSSLASMLCLGSYKRRPRKQLKDPFGFG